MTNILTNIKHIRKYLEEEYLPEQDIYKEFLKQYEDVRALRTQAQTAAGSVQAQQDCTRKLEQARASYQEHYALKERALVEDLQRLEERGLEYGLLLPQLQLQMEETKDRKASAQKNRDSLELGLRVISEQKPGLFAGNKEKEDYRRQVSELTSQLMKLRAEETECAAQENALRSRIAQCQAQQKQCAEQKTVLQRKFADWKRTEEGKIAELEKTVRKYEKISESSQGKPLDMNQEYDDLQLSNPWFDEPYRIAQSRLFLTALRVRKQFLYENRKNLQAAVIIWNQQDKYLEQKIVIEAAWNWINMTIPVISSTFASFSRMCKNLGPETLGHLFIDEAGQALPQAAVGAVYRSRHVMVVGDPSQIKPVLTLDANTLRMLGKHFGVTEKYLSDSASTQTLVDEASQYGFYRKQDLADDSWIGIPLWVHRRCLYPMFTISNVISYDGFMVQGNKDAYGKTGWFDVCGKANNKYVEEQGEFLLQKIRELMEQNPKIADKNEKDEIYVITPFSNVAFRLAQKLREIHFTRYERGKPTNVGTVHTFQGKEAPIVFFVLGADQQSSGAARWAVSEPNMMNVAATRAKKEFYIIGDKKLYLGLGCDVATETAQIIRQYKKQHPELVVEDTPRPAPAEEPAPSEEVQRVTGKVGFVGKGTRSFFAYVSGDDGKEYSITETIYSKTEQAKDVIKKGSRISFVPKQGQKETSRNRREAGG